MSSRPPPLFKTSGFEGKLCICAIFFSWRGARGHGTTDLLTEKSHDHDLGGKRMVSLQLIITADIEQSDGVYISSKENRTPARIRV